MIRSLAFVPCSLVLAAALAAHEDFPHWVTLFDGKGLEKWTYAKDDKPGEWKIEDGLLTQKDQVDYCTVEEFEDYLLELDFKSEPTGGGNSGVYLRGQVEVQIFNSTYHKGKDGRLENGDGGAIYAVGPPSVNAHNKQGEWNHYAIRHLGNTIDVWLNGVLIQDGKVRDSATPGDMRNQRGRARSISKGPIMLQGDHDRMWFRNIRLLTIPKGWRPLWNGKDLAEFTMRSEERDARMAEHWQVQDSAFFNARHGGGGNGGRDLWTRGAFGNFQVHYEYRSDPTIEGGNSGFYLRDQWEIQILGRQNTDGERGKHSDAALYSKKSPAVRARAEDPAAWNVIDARVAGMKISVWQNETLIHDGVVLDTRTDDHSVPTREFSRAPFKLQGDHGKVWFRNLFIKELPEDLK